MSAELNERIADLEALLKVAQRENQMLALSIAVADQQLVTLRRYLKPKVAFESIRGVLSIVGIDALDGHEEGFAIWKHITPAYKVDEITESVLKTLRGER